jgi:hypothetical protein
MKSLITCKILRDDMTNVGQLQREFVKRILQKLRRISNRAWKFEFEILFEIFGDLIDF